MESYTCRAPGLGHLYIHPKYTQNFEDVALIDAFLGVVKLHQRYRRQKLEKKAFHLACMLLIQIRDVTQKQKQSLRGPVMKGGQRQTKI